LGAALLVRVVAVLRRFASEVFVCGLAALRAGTLLFGGMFDFAALVGGRESVARFWSAQIGLVVLRLKNCGNYGWALVW
jgi:hypothetical protein